MGTGYTVDVQHSSDNKLKAGDKKLLEVSIVRKGARKNCHIHAYEDQGKGLVYLSQQDPWHVFDMS